LRPSVPGDWKPTNTTALFARQRLCLRWWRMRPASHIPEAPVHAAKFTESYDLAAGVMLSEGYISERKRTMQSSRADNLYGKLLAAGEALLELIRRFKGRSNKEITAFTGQITALIDRFQ